MRCPLCSDVVRSRPCSLLTHALNCRKLGKSERHTGVKDALIEYWRSCKVDVAEEEPYIYKFFTPRANLEAVSATEAERLVRRRGDIIINPEGKFIMLDTVVSTPYSAPGAEPLPAGTAARAAEKRKRAEYERDYIMESGTFAPFALESFGAWGEEAVDITRVIASGKFGAEDKASISKFERESAVRVSVALQRGVAQQLLLFVGALRSAARKALVPGASAAGP